MVTGLFGIGVSGVRAAQFALLTTEHNIVNAYTPGFNRQTTVQATNVAISTGSGVFGQGVDTTTVKRQYNAFLDKQVNSAQTQVSFLDAQYSQLSQIDLMLADPQAGLSPALQSFFSGVQKVASDPSSLPARQTMLTTAETLTQRFNNLESRLSEIGEQVNRRIESSVSEINAYAKEIANLNQQIQLPQAAFGNPPNDLLDKRDFLLGEINKMVKVNATIDERGMASVFIGTGQQLVVGSNVTELQAVPSSVDPGRTVVALKTAVKALELPESHITGGELGGLLSFRSESLDAAKNELGRVAVSVGLTFNAQYGLGQDLMGRIDGEAGFESELFKISNPRVTGSDTNTGGGSVEAAFTPAEAPSPPAYSGAFSTKLQPSDYELTFTSAGGNYTIRRLSDNESVTGSGTGPVTIDGIKIDITATGAAGDRFLIRPFAEASRNIAVNERVLADPRMVAAGAPVRTMPGNTNTGSMVLGQGVIAREFSPLGVPLPVSNSLTNLPLNVKATATTLSISYQNPSAPPPLIPYPVSWTAVYSDGTESVPTSGDIPLASGTAPLVGFNIDNTYYKVDGRPDDGDTFTIERSTDAVQDGRNALLFAKLQTANTMADGKATYQTSYARLVADNGIRSREAKVRLESQDSLLTQVRNERDALSAVNLDEEAANLMKYQQAYQAAAKVLQVGGTLFDTIISLR